MITIFHGENSLLGRKEFTQFIADYAAKNPTANIIKLDGKNLAPASLTDSLGSNSLFGNSTFVVIEKIFANLKSKKRDEMIKQIASAECDICLWEEKTLTASNLKSFPNAKVNLYKATNTLFSWLDSLSSDQKSKAAQIKLLATAKLTNDAELCFNMLSWKIRQLIKAKETGGWGKPTAASKLSTNQLLALHKQLTIIDAAHKTSTNQITMTQELDLLILKM